MFVISCVTTDAEARGDRGARDRIVLDALRPYFEGRHALWEARRRSAGAAPELEALTARERDVLLLVADGLTNARIAERLWITPGTVRRHLENVYSKLGVHTRTAAVRAASSDS